MVQKGKVEETILESIPQLAIQLVNTWMLGQLQSMPALTIFSISLSVMSLTNTVWYYAYWNLFRCMPIRDVPSTLALYNYKLSGVTDGAFSFAKASGEVVEIEMSEVEKMMMSVTISGTVLNDVNSRDEQLGQLPPRNAMGHASAAELAKMIDVGVSNAAADVSNCAGDSMSGIAENDVGVSRLRQELQDKEAEIEKLKKIQDEKEAEIVKLQEANLQMEAMMNSLRLELQRLPSVTVDANVALHITHTAAADDVIGGIVDGDHSSNSPRVTRAAITLQSVTRGHLGRRLIPARRSEVDANTNQKEKLQELAQTIRGNDLRLVHCTNSTGKFKADEVPNFSQQSLLDETDGVMILDTGCDL